MSSNLAKNTLIYALGDIIPKALSFFTFPILTMYLTPADYGIINYVNTLMSLLFILGFLCVNTYYLVYYFKVGDESNKKKLLGNLSIFVIGLNVLITLILFGIGYLFPNLFSSKIPFFPYIAVGIASSFFNLLTVLPSALYRVQERPMPLTLLNILRGVSSMAITLLLVVYFKFTALGVLYSMLIVNFIFGIIFLQITLKHTILKIDWIQIRAALKFSLPLVPGALSYYLLSMADRLFIEKYLDLTQLGIYSTASTLAMLLYIISYGAYKAFEPHFFKIYGTPEFKPQFIKVQNIYLAVIIFLGMSISLFAKEFFMFFSSEAYHGVFYYVPMIEIGVIFSSMSILYGTIVTAREKTKINSLNTMIGGGISVLLNLTLIPIIGLKAAVLASAIAYAFMMMVSAYFAKLNISFAKPVYCILISAIVVYFSVYILEINNVLFLIGIKFLLLILSSIAIFKLLNINIMQIKVLFKK